MGNVLENIALSTIMALSQIEAWWGLWIVVIKINLYLGSYWISHFFQAKMLAKKCGAQVDLVIRSESGRVYEFHSRPTSSRTVKVQVGEPHVPGAQPLITRAATGTPTETRVTPSSPKGLPIVNLPGKAKKKSTTRMGTRTCNSCYVCGVYFESKKDKNFKKNYKRTNEWVGCDHEVDEVRCDTWGHVRCIGLTIPKGKSASDVPFMCPTHISEN